MVPLSGNLNCLLLNAATFQWGFLQKAKSRVSPPIAQKSSKRQFGVLEDPYSGTFERLVAQSLSILQALAGWHRTLPIKHVKNPLRKGLEAHPAAFPLQHLGQ